MSDRTPPRWQESTLKWLLYVTAVAGTVQVVASAVPEQITPTLRIVIAAASPVIGWLAAILNDRWLQPRRERVTRELERMMDPDRTVPRQALATLAETLFRRGTVWRLTIYAVESTDALGNEWSLRRLCRRSESQAYDIGGRERIQLDRTVLRNLMNVSLPHGEATGEAPDPEGAFGEWLQWQTSITRDEMVASSLRMRSRRYAWFATREPDGDRRTIALVAESLEPDGILVDRVESPLLAPLILMIARWYEDDANRMATAEEARHLISR